MEFVDGRVLVDGVEVGTTGMRWWDEQDGTRVYLLTGGVAPEFQRMGYGRRILAWQEEQARAQANGAGVPVFGTNPVSERDRALVRAAGYRAAFTRVRMTLALSEPAAAEVWPAGVEVREATGRDHRAVFDAIDDVFAGSIAWAQHTFEEFEQDVADDFGEYGLWTLAWHGDRLAGWVISGIRDTPWVGVRPEWRRRGLASALLRANHAQLWAYGVRTASLWTVWENPTGSVALYESLGYRIVERQERYRKSF
ncbi:GNAT family N-acetyltransferase [Kribbella sp. NPDC004536]|uniref:GNAT family N-acetyltransferase n=1 Tax=Kribbella sp. NPDC004536 TaxID=3364106 RepID=UPI0036883991